MKTLSSSPLVLLLTTLLLTTPLSASTTTIAISHSSNTVCAILSNTNTISCSVLPNKVSFTLTPTSITFQSISGGGDFLCGLSSAGTMLLCWSPTVNGSSPKRVYLGPPLSDLAVGEDHVAAAQDTTKVVFWRTRSRGFPAAVDGQFKSITSGNGFSCGIEKNSSRVKCWGGGGVAGGIELGFNNETMSSIVAGGSLVCGLDAGGVLICRGGNGLNATLSSVPNEFSAPSLGSTHLCATRPNESVACWRTNDLGKSYVPKGTESTPFMLVVAGGNLTCGLISTNYTVVCWDLDGSLYDLKFPTTVLPGQCVAERNCSCGPLAGSGNLCGPGAVVCKACDSPSPPPAQPPTPTTSGGSTDSSSNSRRNNFLLAFGIVGSSFGLCSILYCLWVGLFRRKKVHNSVQPTLTNGAQHISPPRAPPTSFNTSIKSFKSRSASSLFRRQRSGPSSAKYDRAEEFTYLELSLATDGFATATRIGSGSFGSVYRGKLPDGREVAIKRSEPDPRPARPQEKEGEFHSELAFLSRLHHKHLVALLGFCDEGDERLLVYEFMPNGTLYDHLHLKDPSATPLHNSWKLRIKLLLDAARGIEYLHSYAVPPIIHRDIKSSNILIDGSWTARVSDFGLSLNGPETEGAKAAGTVGYMDPEYYGLHQVTTKSDVYGFGVVMLEVLTGRRAIFKGEGGLMNVVDYAIGRVMEGEVRRVLDGRVRGDGWGREGEAVELVAFTAVKCVSLEGKERPSMREVVANLEAAMGLCEEESVTAGSASADEEE